MRLLQTPSIVYVTLFIASCYGWVENLHELVHNAGYPLTNMSVARIAGVFFPPLGIILGAFT